MNIQSKSAEAGSFQTEKVHTRHRYADSRKTVFAEFCEHLDVELVVRRHDWSGATFDISDMLSGDNDQSDAYVREVALIHVMTDVELRGKVQVLRQNLKEMLSTEDYYEFIRHVQSTQTPPDSAAAPGVSGPPAVGPSLREEARALLDRSYRRYVLLPKVEQQRSLVSRRMLFGVGSVALALWALLFLYKTSGQAWLGAISIAYLTAAIAGSLGATLSILLRLAKLDMRREPLMLWMNLQQGMVSLWLSPVIGALFGLLFLLLMRSGLVTGALFPVFDPTIWSGLHLDVSLCPGDKKCSAIYRDYTWVIIWTFAAGWAERLVPDVLDRLSKQSIDYARSNRGRAGGDGLLKEDRV